MIDFDAAVELVRARPTARLIGIDGLPVSGKSTLADRLESALGARIVFLDDFVRPEAEWRGSALPAFPFPYIRYAEFIAAVTTLAGGRMARYRRYDWAAGRLEDDWTEIAPDGLVVIEGVSALHPALTPLCDLRLWVESDAATTLEASLARGVGDWEREWRDLFMPSVELYLGSQPLLRADHVVTGRGVSGSLPFTFGLCSIRAMAAAPLLSLQNIKLTFGGTTLLEGAELIVSPGQRIALVGRNGSGKSTLLKIASGDVTHDSGVRFVEPSATLRYLPQEPDLSAFATTLEYVEAGLGPGDDEYRAQYLLSSLGLTGLENPRNLSGGEGRRAALARVLAPRPDILLLDEPTNHLDLPAIEWLQAELDSMRSAMVLISHDRRFLADLTRSTVWLDRGVTRRLDRGFSHFEAWRDQVLEEEERDRHKLDRQIVREEHWLRYGVTARRKRNVGRLERLSGLRQDRREQRRVTGGVNMQVAEGRTSGALVVEAENIAKSYGERVIVGDFSTRVIRGDRIGIVGPNGAGKTTLIKMLTGLEQPDSGKIKLGSALELAMLDQGRAKLHPDTRLKEALTGGGSDTLQINGQPKHVVGYMKDFLFGPEQANTPIGKLSGGERARVALARALSLPSNFLVLDEPTNDLDLETLDLLEEMVSDYAGTVIVVSHDRDFLDRVATSVIIAEGDGVWNEYAGGYSDMVIQRGEGVTAREPAAKAHRPGKTSLTQTTAATSAPAPKRKMSFKEKHALETLPKTIATLEGEISAINAALADPKLYTKDPAAFAAKSKALLAAEAKRAAAEEEWLELEVLREELEG